MIDFKTLSQFEELTQELEKKPYIEKIIEYLKELNFEFVDASIVEKLYKNFEFSPHWTRKYSYLIRRYKDGDKSRLDFRFMVGIHFIGVRMPKYLIYRNGTFKGSFNKPWNKPFEFNTKKKKVLLVFPPELDIEERKVWRRYHDKFKKDKLTDPEQLKWYLKFKPMIKNLDKEFDHL